MSKKKPQRKGGLKIEQRRRGGGKVDPDLQAFRERAVRNPATMDAKERWEIDRRRVLVRAPRLTLKATREIAAVELTTVSQASTALQMVGLVYLVIYRGGLYFLLKWRRETNHPRVPHRLGVPQAWLDLIATLRENQEGYKAAAQKVIAALGINAPVVYPPMERMVIDSVRDEDGWLSNANAAGRYLRVPMGHLLGILQTAGVLAYAGRFAMVNSVFGQDSRRIARNNRDVFHLTKLAEWSSVLGPMLGLAACVTEENTDLVRAATRFAEGHSRVAAKIMVQLRSSLVPCQLSNEG